MPAPSRNNKNRPSSKAKTLYSDSQPREARLNKHAVTDTALKFYEDSDFPALLEGKTDSLVLILDCIQDPHNLGACLRSADAAGCALVIMPKDKTAPISETVRRVACGGAESMPLARVTNLARAMDKLKDLGFWIVGTADESPKSLYQLDLKGNIAIVVGAEGEGMRRLTGEKCDFLGRIPMGDSSTVPCLNVSVATGVCLFEAVRQRQ
ncbi:23S rRNA (guanosine(2251)-2'-O)-methyltransferase RlmB [Phragmitibacter flavus]|uniref:23S rRNA (Guanosine(2251)-2'-O)-methyltransferase RlmB n=1 Tax=Phragmitibacter flavus TaxID=2576071 RepID=A0A5R8KE83_9BACT|nr:23S rRNA (guanosine(2251)-2'-O)-methyltransferase RlmB [Phragmitibacter flavus]TLD70255.1 23S rRNA (guanosine(2251)-2'-O)-methyltransferase RlmB [Phragmitibacter flavus]